MRKTAMRFRCVRENHVAHDLA
ncbi:hypothetical protein EYZ11_008810 [Aspergillus tanneri]|uniref:Uncharacterized protein n=1 Tax=Aspergillus tanneri TaxID=1220188 RepID=A0A4S3J9L4_9EURO|nr:hypothetical protein EYZ11_008810 [Aspergillus tanneri]